MPENVQKPNKNFNWKLRDLGSTEAPIVCLTHAPTVNPCWESAQESNYWKLNITDNPQGWWSIFGTNKRVLLSIFSPIYERYSYGENDSDK